MSKTTYNAGVSGKPTNEPEYVANVPIQNTMDLCVFQEIRGLLKEQNVLLQLMKKRYAEADRSMQPVTPVPVRSSSVWNPLLQCTIKNAQPTLEKWRGSLDTLLIFIGLFSAIITAFLVESLKTLQPNDVARTNELLANLTDIIIILTTQRSSTTSLEFRQPNTFVPTPSDVRINVYWSIALVISISIAALSVAGRSFLALLMKSEGDAASKLTEILERWVMAKALLGPWLEALPQILLIPVALFVTGLLDSLYSLSPGIHAMYTASYICTLSVAIVAMMLCGALVHGIHFPKVSPFQTSVSRFFSSFELQTPEDLEPQSELDALLPSIHKETGLSPSHLKVYHMAIQEAFDDETLEQASAALEGIMTDSRPLEQFNDVEFPDLEFRTILHLLSPEASFRSNLSAAKTIQKIFLGPRQSSIMTTATNELTITYIGLKYQEAFLYGTVSEGLSSYQRATLLRAMRAIDPMIFKHQELSFSGTVSDRLSFHQRAILLTAVRRIAEGHLIHKPDMVDGAPNATLMTAMASLIPIQGRAYYPHPILALLSANYLTRQSDHNVPIGLVETYNHTMWYAISTLIRLLENQLDGGLPSDHTKLNEALTKILGSCTLQPICGKELLLSMMNSPTPTPNTSYRDSVSYELITNCLVGWVAAGDNALETTLAVVDRVLLEYLNPDPTNYQPAQRSYHRVVHHLMMLVYQATQVSSPQSLSLCTKFILKVSETFVWDVGRFMSLRIISRFLILLDENTKMVDRPNMEASQKALTYVYQWTLYRAASFGDYDIILPEFQDTLPPRDMFLSRLHKEWLKFSPEAGSGLDTTIIPRPLPEWELDVNEEQDYQSMLVSSPTKAV